MFELLSDVSSVVDLDICSTVTLKGTTAESLMEDDDDDESRDAEVLDNDDEVGNEDKKAFCIVFGGTAYICFNESEDIHRIMLNALDVAVASSRFQQVESAQDPVIGLRHKILRTTIYSAVCCNDISMLEKVRTL